MSGRSGPSPSSRGSSSAVSRATVTASAPFCGGVPVNAKSSVAYMDAPSPGRCRRSRRARGRRRWSAGGRTRPAGPPRPCARERTAGPRPPVPRTGALRSRVLLAVEQGRMSGDVRGAVGGEAREGPLQQFRLWVRAPGHAGNPGAVPDRPGLGRCSLGVGMARDEPDRGPQTREHHLREAFPGAEARVGAHWVLDELGGQMDRAGSGGRGGGVVRSGATPRRTACR